MSNRFHPQNKLCGFPACHFIKKVGGENNPTIKPTDEKSCSPSQFLQKKKESNLGYNYDIAHKIRFVKWRSGNPTADIITNETFKKGNETTLMNNLIYSTKNTICQT